MGCAAAPHSPPARQRAPLVYSVAFDGERLTVRVRSQQALPRRWRFKRGGGADAALLRSGSVDLELSDARVELPTGARELSYVYDLAGGSRFQRFHSGAGGAGRYMLGGTHYLMRPEPLPGDWPVEVRFAGDVVVPWERDAEGVARITGRDLWDPGFHGFGVQARRMEFKGGAFELVLLPGWPEERAEVLDRWLRQAGDELLTVRRRFPFARVPVFLVPTGSTEVCPFGQVIWSRPPCLALYVGAQASDRAFAEDWVAVHEASHLAHPRFKPPAPWLSEGLATYYQGVARLRSGRLSPEAVWGQLVRGVTNGLRENDGLNLVESSERMHELYCYRTVYWGGALVALELDLELRRLSGGERTLDDVLEALAEDGAQATVEAFARAVDEVAAEPLYGRVAGPHFGGQALERAEALLERVGIEPHRGEARLVSGPDRALLDAIGRPRD